MSRKRWIIGTAVYESTYALKGGFSGTSVMVPSSAMKYRGGVQYADLSWATSQL